MKATLTKLTTEVMLIRMNSILQAGAVKHHLPSSIQTMEHRQAVNRSAVLLVQLLGSDATLHANLLQTRSRRMVLLYLHLFPSLFQRQSECLGPTRKLPFNSQTHLPSCQDQMPCEVLQSLAPVFSTAKVVLAAILQSDDQQPRLA